MISITEEHVEERKLKECRIEGEAAVQEVLHSFNAQWNLGEVEWLSLDRYSDEEFYAGRHRMALCAKHSCGTQPHVWTTILFEGCSEIKLPEVPDYLSAFGLTVEDVSSKQWDRISLEARCLTEDNEWHDGLLWLRCHRARVIAVSREIRSSIGDAVWIDSSAMGILSQLWAQG